MIEILSKHFDAILGVFGTLAGVILGALLKPVADWIAERIAISKRIRTIRTAVNLSDGQSVDNYSAALCELRQIFVENDQLLRWSPNNQEFFGKWLVSVDSTRLPRPETWDGKRIMALQMDIDDIEDIPWYQSLPKMLQRFVDGPKEDAS